MRTQPFGDRQVSVIGFGSGDFGGKYAEGLAREMLDAYVALGGNFIDTARVYGDYVTPRTGESEKVIGRWMADHHCRDRIFLSTKGGHPPLKQMTQSRLSRAEVRSDMMESLDALQTDHVDVYWLHRDDVHRPVGDIMETLQSLIEDGCTGMVGVSNWSPARIAEANRYAEAHGLTKLAANQPQFSLARQIYHSDPTTVTMDGPTWRLHRETGLTCCCFSAQARGFFTKLDKMGWDALPENLRRRYGAPENLTTFERMKDIREATGLSVGAIALAYLTCQPFPTFALVSVSRLEQVEALREAGDAILTPEQRDALRTF